MVSTGIQGYPCIQGYVYVVYRDVFRAILTSKMEHSAEKVNVYSRKTSSEMLEKALNPPLKSI